MTRSSTDAPLPFSVPPNRLMLQPSSIGGAGPINLNGDYSVTPTEAWVASPTGFSWHVESADFFMQGSGNAHANNYGPIAGLLNGILLQVRDADNVGVLPAVNVKTTGGFAAIPGMSISSIVGGPGDIYVVAKWDIARFAGSPIVLGPGMRLTTTLQDDLQGLTVHQVTVAGFLLPAET